MIAGAERLAEVTVGGTVHDKDGGTKPKRVHVALLHTNGRPSVYVAAAGVGAHDGYEVPVDALKDALSALPLKELFRVLRVAR